VLLSRITIPLLFALFVHRCALRRSTDQEPRTSHDRCAAEDCRRDESRPKGRSVRRPHFGLSLSTAMDLTAMLIAALAISPAVGLATWAWLAMSKAEEDLLLFVGLDGLYLED
jgi:hypothetical protein